MKISFPSIAETNSLGMPESLTDAVQYADSLDFNQPWDTLMVTNGMGAMVTVTDTNPATSRFYRLARNGPAQTVSIWYTSRGDGLQHWFTETNVTEDGIQAFEVDLEPIPDPGNHYGQSFGDRSCLTEYVNGPGLVTFWWQAESCDITFSIGGLGIYQVQGQISGMQPWQEQTFQIPAGPQTLEWVAFSPDNLAGSAWVSAVTFTNTSPPTGSQP